MSNEQPVLSCFVRLAIALVNRRSRRGPLIALAVLFGLVALGTPAKAARELQFPAGQREVVRLPAADARNSFVALGAVGDRFLVVWTRTRHDGAGLVGRPRIEASWLDSGGLPIGAPFLIDFGLGPVTVAGSPGGRAVVGYQESGAPGRSLFRWIDVAGTLGPAAAVTAPPRQTNGPAALAVSAAGRVLSAFTATTTTCQSTRCRTESSLVSRPFARFGLPLGIARPTSSTAVTTADADSGVIGGPGDATLVPSSQDGGFLVSWETGFITRVGPRSDATWEPIRTRVVDRDGRPRGPIVEIATRAGGAPTVANLPASRGGGYLVAWSSLPSDRFDDEPTALYLSKVDGLGRPNAPARLIAEEPRQAQLASDSSGLALLAVGGPAAYPVDTADDLAAASPVAAVQLSTSRPQTSSVAVQSVTAGQFVAVWAEAVHGKNELVVASQLLALADPTPIAVDLANVVVVDESGTSDEVTVRLRHQPTADVAIELYYEGTGAVLFSPERLEFAAADWDEPQVVTVTGFDDGHFRGDQLLAMRFGPAESADPNFAGRTPGVVRIRVEEPRCELVITTPAGFVHRGTSVPVRWTAESCGDRVALDLLRAGAVVEAVAADSENDGDFVWDVAPTLLPGTDYQLRLRTLTGPPATATRQISVRR